MRHCLPDFRQSWSVQSKISMISVSYFWKAIFNLLDFLNHWVKVLIYVDRVLPFRSWLFCCVYDGVGRVLVHDLLLCSHKQIASFFADRSSFLMSFGCCVYFRSESNAVLRFIAYESCSMNSLFRLVHLFVHFFSWPILSILPWLTLVCQHVLRNVLFSICENLDFSFDFIVFVSWLMRYVIWVSKEIFQGLLSFKLRDLTL